MTLEEISKQIKNCQKCSLYKDRHNAVPGKGSSRAKIMFIGEGPGKAEDLKGEPFIGASGRFLTELLACSGMKRDDIFITNIVKCRPKDNRDPKKEEMRICSSVYLWRQIELIDPVLIVTLGRCSMYAFLPKNLKISEVHGKLQKGLNEVNGESFDLLPLYHPAAALYNGGLREVLIKDFKKIPNIIKKLS